MSGSRLRHTEAIVIKRIDFGEADRILTLYTLYYGKVRAVAKGSRRVTSKLGGHVELCTHVNLLLARGRNLDIVTQAEAIHAFPNLREDLQRAGSACYVAEIVDRLTADHVESRPIFELLLATLQRIDEGRRPEIAVHSFELQLLAHLGYRAELGHCVLCLDALAPARNFFGAAAGGTICQRCAQGQATVREISVSAIKVLRLLQSGDYHTAARLRVDLRLQRELEAIIQSHVAYILEGEPRSASVLRSIAGLTRP